MRTDWEEHGPDSSNHSLSLIKLFSFSCPEGNKLLDCSVGLSHHERCERQYRHEPPPTCALRQGSPSFKSTHSLSYSKHFPDHGIFTCTCTHKNTYAYTYSNTCSYTFTDLYIYKYLHIYKDIWRHGHHNIRNGIVWAQTGHGTCTCTATLCVIEPWTHQKFESFKKIPQRRKSNSNLLINSKNPEIVRIGFGPHGNFTEETKAHKHWKNWQTNMLLARAQQTRFELPTSRLRKSSSRTWACSPWWSSCWTCTNYRNVHSGKEWRRSKIKQCKPGHQVTLLYEMNNVACDALEKQFAHWSNGRTSKASEAKTRTSARISAESSTPHVRCSARSSSKLRVEKKSKFWDMSCLILLLKDHNIKIPNRKNRSGASESSSAIQQLRHERDHLTVHGSQIWKPKTLRYRKRG